MNLNEAYAYQNYLAGLQNKAAFYIGNPMFCLDHTVTHFRSRSVQDAKDETEKVVSDIRLPECTPDELVSFILDVLDERVRLSEEIASAKRDHLDAKISENKMRRAVISALKVMTTHRGGKTQTSRTDYKLNSDGEQVMYRYPTEEVETPRYDRSHVQELVRTMTRTADDASSDIERSSLYATVYIDPIFDTCDDLDDALDRWRTWKNGQAVCDHDDACDIHPDS